MERALHHLSWAVIFLLIFSCQRDFEPTSPPIPINEGHRNFPLHVGDTWKYEIVRCDFKRELVGQMVVLQITEKVEINGEKYFLFDSNFPRWVCPLDSGLFRVEGRKVFRYFKGKEYMWYDFGAIPGYEFDPKADRWEVPSFAPAGYGMLVQIISIVDCSELSGASVVQTSSTQLFHFGSRRYFIRVSVDHANNWTKSLFTALSKRKIVIK